MPLFRLASLRRHAAPAAALLVLALALAGAGLWQHQRALRAAQAAAFDLDEAMKLAGSQVPEDVESFYFFVLEHAEDEAAELAEKLAQAAAEHDFIGVTGADAEYNREALLGALSSRRERNLEGLVIIYLGPPGHEAMLSAAAQARGADFRFVR